MKPADIWKTVSYIPQSHGFAFSYTGLEMVMLGRSSHMGTFQQPGAREIEMAERMMEKVGITRLAYKDCNRMSGGELQMVLIARALINNPTMIIADEPTGNLDPQRSFEIMLLLEQINALGTTVMVVTHEKGLVDRFTKRVVAIDEGRVVSDGMDGYYSYEAQ